METITSTGECFFCKKPFDKSAINRHLKTHFKEKAKTEKAGNSYLLKIITNPRYGSSGYFLYLWVNGTATFRDLDDFLRAIWLECCGHMSSFTDLSKISAGGFRGNMFDFLEAENLMSSGNIKQYEAMMEDSRGEIPKSRKLKAGLHKGQKIEYEYDFGSTTSLLITVEEDFEFAAPERVFLLSRNEPLELLCETCKKEPATEFCTVHGWGDECMFCPKCAKKHRKECPDFDDYAGMPIVNSPRMGVCAYAGGTIDTKRDGVFKKPKQDSRRS